MGIYFSKNIKKQGGLFYFFSVSAIISSRGCFACQLRFLLARISRVSSSVQSRFSLAFTTTHLSRIYGLANAIPDCSPEKTKTSLLSSSDKKQVVFRGKYKFNSRYNVSKSPSFSSLKEIPKEELSSSKWTTNPSSSLPLSRFTIVQVSLIRAFLFSIQFILSAFCKTFVIWLLLLYYSILKHFTQIKKIYFYK